uniref:Uncharacterized protein n=1 Tax=Arundo donax TaxID=35708 RepID=A0A0A9DIG5_ARUDO
MLQWSCGPRSQGFRVDDPRTKLGAKGTEPKLLGSTWLIGTSIIYIYIYIYIYIHVLNWRHQEVYPLLYYTFVRCHPGFGCDYYDLEFIVIVQWIIKFFSYLLLSQDLCINVEPMVSAIATLC